MKGPETPALDLAPAPAALHLPRSRLLAGRWLNPQIGFAILSLVFGCCVIALTPPLRGPDEAAHFLRAYGIASGEIVPAITDDQGRKGLFLPGSLYAEFRTFEAAHAKERLDVEDDVATMREVETTGSTTASDGEDRGFVLYEGSEGYPPVPYLPHSAAAALARGLDLDFAATLYLMRITGLVFFTALIAYAIAITPVLKWCFVAIAMLPAALYGRAVISADGATLGFSLVVVALCLRQTLVAGERRPGEQSLWMTLCILAKPTNIVFALFPLVMRPLRESLRQWKTLVLIVVPGCTAAALWFGATSADAGAWRLSHLTGIAEEQFDPLYKLTHMLEDPLHFPAAMAATLSGIGELWRQMIGVLGLFDIVLTGWTYPLISLLLLGTFVVAFPGSASGRLRVGAIASLCALGYALAVFLIFYLVWTPIDAEEIWGVQGRYFIPALPLVALVIACCLPTGLSDRTVALIGLCCAIGSGVATLEAVAR